MKKKPDIKYLRYPLWCQIVFFCLTTIVPIIFVMVEGYKSPSTSFKWTFGIVSGLFVVWSFIYKFLVKGAEDAWRERQLKLEHDYEIDVGNSEKIRWLWFNYELKLNICMVVRIGLLGLLLGVVINAIAESLMQVRGIIIAIAICYVVAYTIKFIVIAAKKGAEDYAGEQD